jgi:hypothetical protein
MTHYDSTARVPFKHGGSVKKPKVKRIILWKGKAKDWPGAKEAARQTRNRKAEGGRIEFKKGGKTKRQAAKSELHRSKAKSNGSHYTTTLGGFPIRSDWHKAQKKHKKKYPKLVKNIEHDVKKLTDKAYEAGPRYKKPRPGSGRVNKRKGFIPGKKPGEESFAKGGKAKDSVHQPTTHSWWLLNRNKRDKKAEGGKADKNWIQGVNKSIKKRGTKGVCTGKKFGSASCKPGSKRYNLAKTFKKMARAKHASGGLVRYI